MRDGETAMLTWFENKASLIFGFRQASLHSRSLAARRTWFCHISFPQRRLNFRGNRLHYIAVAAQNSCILILTTSVGGADKCHRAYMVTSCRGSSALIIPYWPIGASLIPAIRRTDTHHFAHCFPDGDAAQWWLVPKVTPLRFRGLQRQISGSG